MVILVFLFGLIFGSFLNVVIARLDRKEGILLGHSQCPHCKHQLIWNDLIPLVSFLILKRKCRYCRHKISVVYPLVELVTGIVFALFYLQNGIPTNIESVFELIVAFFLISVIFFDYLYRIIPDKIIIPLITLSLTVNFLFKKLELTNLLISGLLLGGFFAILHIVSRGEWVGLGDAKLLLLVGFYFGYPNSFLITVFSIWTAALAGLTLIALKKASLKSELPFGVFLSIFSIIFILFQHEIQIFTYFFY